MNRLRGTTRISFQLRAEVARAAGFGPPRSSSTLAGWVSSEVSKLSLGVPAASFPPAAGLLSSAGAAFWSPESALPALSSAGWSAGGGAAAALPPPVFACPLAAHPTMATHTKRQMAGRFMIPRCLWGGGKAEGLKAKKYQILTA